MSPPHSSQPACLKMLANVPGGRVSLSLPDTVTRPGFVGCLNCRWPPLDLTCTQPSERSLRSTSLTFIPRGSSGLLGPRKRSLPQRQGSAQAKGEGGLAGGGLLHQLHAVEEVQGGDHGVQPAANVLRRQPVLPRQRLRQRLAPLLQVL